MNRSKDDILRELNENAAKIGGHVNFDGYGYTLSTWNGGCYSDSLAYIRRYIKKELKVIAK